MNTSIGKNIKRLREERGWYQDELAKRLDVTQKAVSAWENGVAQPRMAMLNRICQVFGCKVSDITEEINYTGTWAGTPVTDYSIQLQSAGMNPNTVISIEERNDEDAERLLRMFHYLNEMQKSELLKKAIDLMMEGK